MISFTSVRFINVLVVTSYPV